MKIIVTGSSKGIGKAIALEFLNNGHQVYGIDLLPSTINHPSYTHLVCDILSPTLPKLEPCDILINNAGVQNSGNDIDINLKGTINVTKAYGLHKDIKSVLFIASASGQTGAEFPEYAASKGGMIANMKNVALEIAKYGATANSLSPGGVITDINNHILNDPSLYEKVLNETLLNKWATADEIAQFAYFLTAVNKSMTGQDLLIDNGEAHKSNFIW
jgi:NAD(P)-dependent dehydrogenase (short-subunit alcohol dehydrogenase family)